jgi:hypothetical protein
MPEGVQTFIETASAGLSHLGYQPTAHGLSGNEVHVQFEKDGKTGFVAATIRECEVNNAVPAQMLSLCKARIHTGLLTWANNH